MPRFLSLLLAIVALVVLLQPWKNADASASDSWAKEHVRGDEALVCAKSLEGESFFVGRVGNRVKLGYRLKVPSPSASPFSLVASWWIFDSQGKDIAAQVPPMPVISRIVQSGQQLFSESVEYQALTESPPKVKVELRVKKCNSDDCEVLRRRASDEVEYVVNLCD